MESAASGSTSFIPTGVFSLLLQRMTMEANELATTAELRSSGLFPSTSNTSEANSPNPSRSATLSECRSALLELLANEGREEQIVKRKRLNLEKTITQLKKSKLIGHLESPKSHDSTNASANENSKSSFISDEEKTESNLSGKVANLNDFTQHMSQIFRSPAAADLHFKKKHQPKKGSTKAPSDCEECGKSFASAFQLREHIAIQHLKERNFKCDQCEQRFGRRGGLRRHIQMVHQNHLHKCPYEECDHPGYKCSKALTAHIRSVHTNVRPFVCGECEKAFVRKNDLKMHQLTHRKDIEFTCECGHRFRRQMYLKKHQKNCERYVTSVSTS